MSNDTTTAPLPSAIPHVTRRECANALIQLSAQIVLDSASLLRFSSGILKGEPVAGRIKRYAGSLGQSRGAEPLSATTCRRARGARARLWRNDGRAAGIVDLGLDTRRTGPVRAAGAFSLPCVLTLPRAGARMRLSIFAGWTGTAWPHRTQPRCGLFFVRLDAATAMREGVGAQCGHASFTSSLAAPYSDRHVGWARPFS